MLVIFFQLLTISYIYNKDFDLFDKELNIIKSIRHPNILMFLGACKKKNERYIS